MRNLKKFFAVVLVVALMITSMATAFAATTPAGTDEGNALKELGLYTGIDGDLALSNSVKRFESMVMLGKILGIEEAAEAEYATVAAAKTELAAKFTDTASLPDWAVKTLAYEVKTEMVQGGDGLLQPNGTISAAGFATMIARNVLADGDIQPETALSDLAAAGAFTFAQVAQFAQNTNLTRGVLVQVAYNALKAEDADGVTVIEKLAENNEELAAIAEEQGLIVPITAETAKITETTLALKVGDDAAAKLPAKATVTYSKGDPAEVAITWPAVDTSKAAAETTITGTVGDTGLTVSIKVTVTALALAVDSVTAINLKEITVVFNSAVTVTRSNFMIDGASVADGNFKLSDDKKTVTLYNAATPVAGQKIKVAIVNVTGLSTTLKDVTVNDSSLPTVEKVETVGNKLIKITYSEPMFAGASTISNYKVSGYVKSGSVAMSNMNKTVNITLTTALADGTYDLAVNSANVKDFAGNALGVNSTSFVIAKDAAVPGYTVLSATQQTVKIKFDREVTTANADMRLFWKDGSTEKLASGVRSTTDLTEWTFTFAAGDRMPAGTNTLKIKKVIDYSGNTKTDYEVAVNAVVDVDRPAYVSYTQKDSTTFEFKFSKKITLNSGNFTFKDSQGIAASVGTLSYKSTDDTVVVVPVTSLITTRNPYTVTIKDVIDTTYLQNRAEDVILTLSIDDKVAPTVVGSATRSGNTISVVFNEDIDQGSFSMNNVKYSEDNGVTYRELPTAAYVTFVGTRTINITFPSVFGPSDSHVVPGIEFLYISDVVDLSGNKMIAVPVTVGPGGTTVAINNGSAYMIDTKTILVEPAQTLADVFVGDFQVKAGSTDVAIDKVELVQADTDVNKYAKQTVANFITGFAPNEQLIKITLVDAINANATKTISGTPTAITVSTVADVQLSKNALGAPLLMTNVSVADRAIPTAPDAAKFAYDNTATITIGTPFIADEQVTVEYVAVDGDIAAPTYATAIANAADIVAANTVFTAGTAVTLAAGAPVPGTEVYVRFVDSASNETAWVKIATRQPAAPIATFTFDADGNGITNATGDAVLATVTDVMEYSLDGGTTYTPVATAATTVDLTSSLASISASNDIKVRVKATSTVPAGKVQTIDVVLAPAAPSLVYNTSGGNALKTTIVGATTAMEYSIDNGTTWTTCTADMELTILAGANILVRVTATAASATTATPAGAINSHTMLASEIHV